VSALKAPVLAPAEAVAVSALTRLAELQPHADSDDGREPGTPAGQQGTPATTAKSVASQAREGARSRATLGVRAYGGGSSSRLAQDDDGDDVAAGTSLGDLGLSASSTTASLTAAAVAVAASVSEALGSDAGKWPTLPQKGGAAAVGAASASPALDAGAGAAMKARVSKAVAASQSRSK
jgi:hypothetical protein